jgi:hypothetical protein
MAFVEFLEGFARISDKEYITTGASSVSIQTAIERNIMKILRVHKQSFN